MVSSIKFNIKMLPRFFRNQRMVIVTTYPAVPAERRSMGTITGVMMLASCFYFRRAHAGCVNNDGACFQLNGENIIAPRLLILTFTRCNREDRFLDGDLLQPSPLRLVALQHRRKS